MSAITLTWIVLLTYQNNCVPSVARVLDVLLNTDEGYETIEVFNSCVSIKSTSTDKIVSMGSFALPPLLRVMKTPGVSFDTFIRCYSVCDRILQSQDRQRERVFWTGGCLTSKNKQGKVRFSPFGQIDNADFRQQVIKDIISKLESTADQGRKHPK